MGRENEGGRIGGGRGKIEGEGREGEEGRKKGRGGGEWKGGGEKYNEVILS